MRRRVMGTAVVAVFACGIAVSGCSGFNEARGRGDAPVASRDDEPKEVINFPDSFSNVAHACDGHGHRVYVTTRTDGSRAMFVTPDESCGGAGAAASATEEGTG